MTARGWVLFAAMSVIWGIPYLLIKIALDGLSVPFLVFARTAIGAAVLLPFVVSRANIAIVVRRWKPLVGFALFEIIAAWLLLSDAEHHLTSSTTGLLIAATPIIAAVLDRLTGGLDRLRAPQMIGLGVGFAGVAVLAGPGVEGGGVWPVTEVLLAAACYAIAPLIAARHLGDVPALPMTAACLGFAAVVYTGPAVLHWPSQMPGTRVLFATGALALICTALAFVIFLALIREVGAPRALVVTYVNPAVALAAGVVVLGEPLIGWNIGGLVLILCGSALATRRSPPSVHPAGAEPSAPQPGPVR